jgi:hypothetical protein
MAVLSLIQPGGEIDSGKMAQMRRQAYSYILLKTFGLLKKWAFSEFSP